MTPGFLSHLPSPILNGLDRAFGACPFPLKYGAPYRKSRALLRCSEFWSAGRLAEFQLRELRKLLEHAMYSVPFYIRLRERDRLSPQSFNSLDDLRRLPLIGKDDVRRNPADFVSDRFPENERSLATTGGSTGEPMHFYSSSRDRKSEWAFVHHLWQRVGFKPTDWRIVLRGSRVDSKILGQNWQELPRTRELLLSGYHLDDVNMAVYYEIAKSRGYRFLHCHPSAAFVFANFLQRQHLTLPLQAVLTASEPIHSIQRELFENVFQCRVYSFYGLSERACIAGECENSSFYHVQPQFGITELLDENGKEVTEEGGAGEIVATGFLNRVMPFIRYRTGDRAVASIKPCTCGREYRLFRQITGRSAEYVIARDGTSVSLTGLIFGQHFQAFKRIAKMQIQQRLPGEIEIVVIRTPDFSEADETEIRQRIRQCMGDKLTASVRYVTEIPLTRSGKHRFLIQNLARPDASLERLATVGPVDGGAQGFNA